MCVLLAFRMRLVLEDFIIICLFCRLLTVLLMQQVMVLNKQLMKYQLFHIIILQFGQIMTNRCPELYWKDHFHTKTRQLVVQNPTQEQNLHPMRILKGTVAVQCAASVWADYDEKVSTMKALQSPNIDASKQMSQFLIEPLVPRQDNCLEWWQSRTSLYPRLVPIVRQRLCLVANSVPSCRAFLPVSTDRRRSFSPSEMRRRVFLNANL